MSQKIIEVAGEIRHEKLLAYLFYDGVRECWLPKSQCQWDPDDKTMQMPEWLAYEKELI